MYKKAGNEYRLTPYKVGPNNFCKSMADSELIYPDLHAHTNFLPIKSCDFKNGYSYFIKNYLPDLSKVPPVMSSGDYMAECNISRADTFIQGFRAYIQIYNFPSIG
jgi:hypothetical protein